MKCETIEKTIAWGFFYFGGLVFFVYLFCTQRLRLVGVLLLLNDKWEFRVRWNPMIGNCIAAEKLLGGRRREEA